MDYLGVCVQRAIDINSVKDHWVTLGNHPDLVQEVLSHKPLGTSLLSRPFIPNFRNPSRSLTFLQKGLRFFWVSCGEDRRQETDQPVCPSEPRLGAKGPRY